MKIHLSKDRIIQISLAGVVAILIIVVIVLTVRGKNGSEIPFVLTQNGEVIIDETAVKIGGENKETGSAATVATGTNDVKSDNITPPPATTTAGGCKPGISGKKSQMPPAILLNWTVCSNDDDFQFYKLVKSQTNPNPSYPNDPVVMSTSNIKATNYVDKTVAHTKTYYYKVCVVQRLSKTTCGNAIAVTY